MYSLASLDMSAWVLNEGICANLISSNVSFAGPYLFFYVFLAGFFVPFTYIPDLANDFGMSSSQVSDTCVRYLVNVSP